MSTPKLGYLATGQTDRDAIHIAVAPVVAGTNLAPGQHVVISDDGKAYLAERAEGIGIVDPFCHFNIEAGEKFWLFMYPDTITGLRHQWSHPAFADSADVEWLKKFGEEAKVTTNDGVVTLGYERLMAYAHAACDTDGPGPGFRYEVDAEYQAEFWLRFGRVTGKGPDEGDGWCFFSCSC